MRQFRGASGYYLLRGREEGRESTEDWGLGLQETHRPTAKKWPRGPFRRLLLATLDKSRPLWCFFLSLGAMKTTWSLCCTSHCSSFATNTSNAHRPFTHHPPLAGSRKCHGTRLAETTGRLNPVSSTLPYLVEPMRYSIDPNRVLHPFLAKIIHSRCGLD